MKQLNLYYLGGGGGGGVPDGRTVVPTNDAHTWIRCAGRTENYTTLSEILADSVCLNYLMASDNAVDYLVRSTLWVSDVTSDSNAMTYIGQYDYCANTLLNDISWRSAILTSTYFANVLTTVVPQMVSNTSPEGEVTASSTTGSGTGDYTTGSDYYWAFDRNESTLVGNKGENTSGFRITYEFPYDVTIYKSVAKAYTFNNNGTFVMQCQHYDDDTSAWVNDGSSYTIIANTTYTTNYGTGSTARKFSLYSATLKTENHSLYIKELQFYGRRVVE